MQFLILVASAAVAFQPTTTTPRRATKLFEKPREGPGISVPRNVLGGDLECCCADVRGSGIGTGFYRDGHCSTGQDDEGRHTVCIEATEDFLEFSASVGNDLSTPNPQWMFPGARRRVEAREAAPRPHASFTTQVMPGDQWCLCAARYALAVEAGSHPHAASGRRFRCAGGSPSVTRRMLSSSLHAPWSFAQQPCRRVLCRLARV